MNVIDPDGCSGTPEDSSARTFEEVLQAELAEVRTSRTHRLGSPARESPQTAPESRAQHETKSPPQEAHSLNLFGLAFSGGGIRSATFNLGILQALAEMRILSSIDYLSTVSGGGYIGCWFLAWCKRLGGVSAVESYLCRLSQTDPSEPNLRPIRHLREFSNYLSPRTSLLSADFWVMIGIWFRNSLLNQLVLAGLIAWVILTARLIGLGVNAVGGIDPKGMLIAAVVMVLIALLLPSALAGYSLRWYTRSDGLPRWSQTGVLVRVIVPLMIGAIASAGALWLWLKRIDHTGSLTGAGGLSASISQVVDRSPESRAWTAGAAAFVAFTICLWTVAFVARYRKTYFQLTSRSTSRVWAFCESTAGTYGFAALAALCGGILVRILAGILDSWDQAETPWLLLTVGTASALSIFGLVKIIHIGLLGFNFPDERREWWSRLGAWLLLCSIGWLLVFGVAVYGPLWIARLWVLGYKKLSLTAALGWIFTTASGVLSARSPDTGRASKGRGAADSSSGPAPLSSKAKEILAVVAPWVFVIGLLLLISLGTNVLIQRLHSGEWASWEVLSHQHFQLIRDSWKTTIAAWIVCLAVTALLAWRVDVNEFSLHHFYRNRLVRAYLGATHSAATRVTNPFTGFDRFDDLKLARFRTDDYVRAVDPKAETDVLDKSGGPKLYVGPLPIVNATLNLAAGTNLAWQERKAASFSFTPLYCGYEVGSSTSATGEQMPDDIENDRGFRPTCHYGYEVLQGPSIGTAVAISGAAANPNSGYHTSSAVSFLLTFFDARLGWWMGNPRHRTKFNRSGPKIGTLYLLAELTSNTTDTSDYVNLSDGGHFENLGIYELVRRRCRLIICCDAEEDHRMTFGGLGGAIRKCRTDFGVEIDIDLTHVRRANGSRKSERHWAIGTINYVDGAPGCLVYLKSSLNDDEPADVREYADREPMFPHQSTGDQWFDESQFESYRKLGYHVGSTSLNAALDAIIANSSVAKQSNTACVKLVEALKRRVVS